LNKRTKAHAGLLATNIFFAINLSAVKYLTGNKLAGPYGINVIRIGICVLLFWLLFFSAPIKEEINKKDIPRFLWCALTALAINQMLFMKGLSYTSAVHVALLFLITPILITFIAAWLLKEKVTTLKIIGLLIGFTGAVLLISTQSNSVKGNNVLLGDLLVIGSALAYTFYFILVKPLMQKYDTMSVMRWIFTFGLIMILPFGWNEFTQIKWQHYEINDYLLMFLIVVPGTFLAYVFNVHGIKVLGASIAGAYIYLQPVFAVVLATIFLKEEFETYKLISAVLIFGGVYLVNKKVNND
jgi:drug/metabolite transporter (DMT)-like permease